MSFVITDEVKSPPGQSLTTYDLSLSGLRFSMLTSEAVIKDYTSLAFRQLYSTMGGSLA